MHIHRYFRVQTECEWEQPEWVRAHTMATVVAHIRTINLFVIAKWDQFVFSRIERTQFIQFASYILCGPMANRVNITIFRLLLLCERDKKMKYVTIIIIICALRSSLFRWPERPCICMPTIHTNGNSNNKGTWF